ncbi:hypothetical protein OG266_38850 [Streptomyces sp. NBC_00554]|uniref:hypothetical protein n=1 Tax=Streptomyces sp. NBC_00554 TaxID=2903661 RepID=UPI00352D2C8F|nr:hypothetical protein OG266_38850 [Streptomyces sp. NBC_00554]
MRLTPANKQVKRLLPPALQVARPRPGHRPRTGGIAIPGRHPRTHTPSTAEAASWAEVLVRHQLLHAAVLAPTGQWLFQHRAESPVQLLDDPTAVVDLAAEIQHDIRTRRNHAR